MLHNRYLDGPDVWVCSSCKTHLSTNGMIISKQFTGRGGRAFLFDKVCVRVFPEGARSGMLD